jgi:hypothetical protein
MIYSVIFSLSVTLFDQEAGRHSGKSEETAKSMSIANGPSSKSPDLVLVIVSAPPCLSSVRVGQVSIGEVQTKAYRYTSLSKIETVGAICTHWSPARQSCYHRYMSTAGLEGRRSTAKSSFQQHCLDLEKKGFRSALLPTGIEKNNSLDPASRQNDVPDNWTLVEPRLRTQFWAPVPLQS